MSITNVSDAQLSTDCIPRAGEPGGVCSGRGTCIALNATHISAACLCESGWSSIGDFATDPSVDCGIYMPAVRGLWGLCAFTHTLLMSLAVVRLWQKRKTLSLKRLEARIFSAVLAQSVLMTIVGIMQAANDIPGARSLGIDPITTTLFVIGTTAYFTGLGFYHMAMLNVAAQQVHLTVGDAYPIRESSIRAVRYLLPLFLLLCYTATFVIFGFLAGNPKNDQIFGSLHYLIFVVALVALVINVEMHTVPMIKQIQQLKTLHPTNTAFDVALNTLQRTVAEGRINGAIQMISVLIIGSVPMLLRKVSYQMPVAWSLIALGAIDNFRHIGTTSQSSNGGRKTELTKRKSKKDTTSGVKVMDATPPSGAVSPICD